MKRSFPYGNNTFKRQAPVDGRYFEQQSRRKQSLFRLDPILLGLLLLLMCTGLINLYSASGASTALTSKQLISFTVGLGLMVVVASIPPKIYQAVTPWGYVGGLILLLLVMLVGDVRLGAQRWLSLPGIGSIQPSEVVKIAVPMMVAWFLADRPSPPSIAHTFMAIAIIGVPVLLVAEQPDLGTAMLVLAAGSFVLFFAGLSYRLIFGALAAFVAFIPVAWVFLLHEYQKQRVITLLDPSKDSHGTGWNIIQSMASIGSGGMTGKGYLAGTQSHLEFLPEAHTDFAIAAFSEEMGLLRVLLLLVLYGCIVWRVIDIGMQVKNNYQRWLVCSIGMSFGLYVFINMSMVAGILPVVGVPLPFISYGGTAAIMLMIGFGLVMSVYGHQR